jgi:hypothetical protein
LACRQFPTQEKAMKVFFIRSLLRAAMHAGVKDW